MNFSRTLSTEDVELTNVVIYPNPTSDVLNIEGIPNVKVAEFYSVQGKQIKIPKNTSTQIDVRSLQSGIYFLKIIDDQNRSVIRKFIKK